MPFYENTIVARQDLAEKELSNIKNKYKDLIDNFSGKTIKVEEWGLLNLAKNINNFKKAFFIHYKFEGNIKTLNEIEKRMKLDKSILRHLTVKYKTLDTKNEFFSEKRNYEKKK